MKAKELRREWCEKKGFNYIDFETLNQAEEYILFLEKRIEKLTLTNASQQRELLRFMEYLSKYWGIDDVIDCTKHQQVIEQYKP